MRWREILRGEWEGRPSERAGLIENHQDLTGHYKDFYSSQVLHGLPWSTEKNPGFDPRQLCFHELWDF